MIMMMMMMIQPYVIIIWGLHSIKNIKPETSLYFSKQSIKKSI